MPAVSNLAAAFQASALEALANDSRFCDSTDKAAAMRALNGMILSTAYGQYLDVQRVANESDYWRVVEFKSSPFYGAALNIGAFAAGASLAAAEQLMTFGRLYGEMIQIQDDLKDTMAVPANSDWTLGRAPLPILYAQVVQHPERERFLELRANALDVEALKQAQSIIIRCGGVSYSVRQFLKRYEAAKTLLNHMPLVRKDGLEMLLEEIYEPVRELLELASAVRAESGVPAAI
jgi:geranylgeranyl pyrophosphate synthase